MDQLKAIFQAEPCKEKWIVGQNVRQVYQWIRDLAMEGVPAMNYRVMSYQMLAEEWTRHGNGAAAYAHQDERLLAVGDLFEKRQAELAYYKDVRVDIHWVEALVDSLDELRLMGIGPGDFPLEAFSPREKAQDLKVLLAAYEAWLMSENKMDAARAYHKVMEMDQVQTGQGIEMIILDDGFKLMPLLRDFRDFCLSRGATLVSMAPRPADQKKPALLKAYGDLSEIHQVFETVKSSGVSFDQVQIIATKAEQLTRIAMIANHEAIPYTASLGDAVFALPQSRKWIFDALDQIERPDFWQAIPATDSLEEEVREDIHALLKRYAAYAAKYGDSAFMREIFHQSLIRVRRKGQPRLPGRVFVTDLSGADAKQRTMTFVLGLDHLSSQDGLTDGPILYDHERTRISDHVVTVQDRKRETAQKRKRDLDRLRGKVYYSYSCYDAANFTEKFPSPVILNHYDTKTCQNHPMASYRIPLDKAISPWEWELASRPFPQELESAYPNLAAGRHARKCRKSGDFNAYNGQVDWADRPDEHARPSSVTRFEKYARSPYLYWLENVLEAGREPEPDEPTIWLNALEKGTLLHEIFQAYYDHILPEGKKPSRARDEEALIAYAHERIEILAKANPPKVAVAREVFILETEETCKIFLSMEEANLGQDRPVSQEFDVSGRLTMDNGESIRLKGKVDRMDQTPSGTYRIYDYKTGKSKDYNMNQYFAHGSRLQHAVYALLVEQGKAGRVESSGYLFPTRRGSGRRIVYPEKGVANRIDVIHILTLLKAAYAAGHFPPGIMKYANQDSVYPELAEQNPDEKEQKDIFASVEALQEVYGYE